MSDTNLARLALHYISSSSSSSSSSISPSSSSLHSPPPLFPSPPSLFNHHLSIHLPPGFISTSFPSNYFSIISVAHSASQSHSQLHQLSPPNKQVHSSPLKMFSNPFSSLHCLSRSSLILFHKSSPPLLLAFCLIHPSQNVLSVGRV